MNGKERCKILKEIRKQIALDNDITLITQECKHRGECKGSCPKCEAEVRFLEKELSAKKHLGRAITIAGLSMLASYGLSACDDEIDGDIEGPDYYYDSSVTQE